MARILARVIPRQIMLDRRNFAVWESRGYHVTPVSFYEPIPDTSVLDETLWSQHSELAGVELNEPGQLALLAELQSMFKPEWDELPAERQQTAHQYFVKNGFFESVDGEILYALVRRHRPHRILEVGSGYSTYLAAHAIRKNATEDLSYSCDLIAVEPFPNAVLRRGFPGLTRLIEAPVQQVSLAEFTALRANDILFIDSSHVLKIGSDVHYEILSVLPRLAEGVLVHVHDIFFPDDYPRHWVLEEHRFWNEQYVLQAFLCFNHRFRIIWAGNYMHTKHPDLLETAFQSYDRVSHRPGSLWLRRV